MIQNYKLGNKLVACFLLLSLCLQSCGNFNTSLDNIDKVPKKDRVILPKPIQLPEEIGELLTN